jgi:hypothetical protein
LTVANARSTRSRKARRDGRFFRGSTWRGKATFLNTFMCGQIAYDWKTIPRPRSFAGTRTRFSDEKSKRPSIEISPSSGVSSPATQRSVVVFPHPEGPSSVNISPSWTSTVRSSTA